MYKELIFLLWDMEDLTAKVGVYQRLALSLHCNALMHLMDELTKWVQEETSWCMMFGDVMVLVDQKTQVLESKHERYERSIREKCIENK